MRPRSARPTLVATLLLPLLAPPAAAQLPAPTIPRGLLRFEGFAGFTTGGHRFRDGEEQPLAADFARESVGSEVFPFLAPAEEILKQATGLPTARFALGATTARQFVTVGRSGLGLGYGLTDRVTLFGRVPFVRVKVRPSLSLDSTGSRAGFNPADPVFGTAAGAAAAGQFFTAFDAALTRLQENLAAGTYDSVPATRTLAEQTLAEGRILLDLLQALQLVPGTASPFLPTASSAEGLAIISRVAALQATLTAPLGIMGFDQAPVLPAQRLSDDEFRNFLTSPDGAIAGSLEAPVLSSIGDIELGAAFSFIDNLGESERAPGIRVAGQALFRLPTGQVEQPDALFDRGTGEGQPDVELGLLADIVMPAFGVRLDGGYTLQLARTFEQRIAAPSTPFPPVATLASVERNPGDILHLGATPFLRLTRTFAVLGGARYSRKSRDDVTLSPGQPEVPGAPVDLLEMETDASWLVWNAGISYRTPLIVSEDRRRMPLDAGVTISGVAAANGGRVDKTVMVRGFLRLYARFP